MRHYNWYVFTKVMEEYFNLSVQWKFDNIIVVANHSNSVTINKNNNMSPQFVEEILAKINISMEDFEEGYRHVKATGSI